MKLRKGKANYKMPPYSEILNAVVGMDGPFFHLQRVRDISSERNKVGEPRFFALSENGIEIAPKPIKGGKLIVRFVPPVQEV